MKRILTAIWLAAASTVAWAMPITVTESNVCAFVHDNAPSISNCDLNTSLNYSNTVSISSGNSSSQTAINWTGNNVGVLLDFSTEHSFTMNGVITSESWAQYVEFTANGNVTYDLSGFYQVASGVLTPYTGLQVFFDDVSGGTSLFTQRTVSQQTANEMFTIGIDGLGDQFNEVLGSLTGSLVSGHRYSFYWSNAIGFQGPASAIGNVCLAIGVASCAAVPTPATLALLGVGLAGLGWSRRKKV